MIEAIEKAPTDRRTYYKAWAAENAEHRQAYLKANRERIAVSNAAYYAAHRDKSNAVSKAHHAAHPGVSTQRIAVRRAGPACPSWANKAAMEAVYAQAFVEGKHVDHIYPLNASWVSGLHVETNLQLLPGSENISKGNRFNEDFHVH